MKIYLLGDSISIQYSPFLKSYLPNNIEYSRKEGEDEALLNLDNPQGANGGDSSMVVSFLKKRLQSKPIDSDYMLLNCGLHDIKTDPKSGQRQTPIEAYQTNLQNIIDLVTRMRIQLVWISSTPINDDHHNSRNVGFFRYNNDVITYNRIAKELMDKSQVPIIDLYQFTTALGDDLFGDHAHFKVPIRQLQAAFIAGWLNRIIP